MKHKVVVVTHQAIGEHLAIEARKGLSDHVQQGKTVVIILENGLLPITTRGNMVDGAGELDSKWTGHARRISLGQAKYKA
jgi:hypothetical protein